MLKKIGICLLIILITPIIAGLYGIIHNQISFTISPEYFTKFKLIQFDIAPALPYRLGASIVGWRATWWMGVPLGIILGLVGLIQFNWNNMILAYFKSIPTILFVTLLTGLFGLFYAYLFSINDEPSYFKIYDVIDKQPFILAGSMHNFSYLGGLTGLIAGIIYQIKFKLNKISQSLLFKLTTNKN